MITFNAATGGFPSTVYHPIFGARPLTDANHATTLGPDWFNTAEEADLHRTETEAQVVVHNNRTIKTDALIESQGVVRNSVAATESLNAGKPEPL